MIVTMQALRRFGLDTPQTRVVIQGFGNVGGMAARLMARAGFKIVCIIEYDGAVYNPHGLDIEALRSTATKPAPSPDSRTAKTSTRRGAVPRMRRAAAGRQRERHHLRQRRPLQAKISAKAPTARPRREADAILAEKKIFVIPDILANAGGVTVSYFEWVQDRQGYFWNEQLVNGRLEEIMVNSFEDVVGYAEKHNVNNRMAAYMLAIDRVAFAFRPAESMPEWG